MPSRKASARKSVKGSRANGLKARARRLVVVRGRKTGRYAERTREVFNEGVRVALRQMARDKITTAAEINGEMVRGIPGISGGSYVLRAGPSQKKTAR